MTDALDKTRLIKLADRHLSLGDLFTMLLAEKSRFRVRLFSYSFATPAVIDDAAKSEKEAEELFRAECITSRSCAFETHVYFSSENKESPITVETRDRALLLLKFLTQKNLLKRPLAVMQLLEHLIWHGTHEDAWSTVSTVFNRLIGQDSRSIHAASVVHSDSSDDLTQLANYTKLLSPYWVKGSLTHMKRLILKRMVSLLKVDPSSNSPMAVIMSDVPHSSALHNTGLYILCSKTDAVTVNGRTYSVSELRTATSDCRSERITPFDMGLIAYKDNADVDTTVFFEEVGQNAMGYSSMHFLAMVQPIVCSGWSMAINRDIGSCHEAYDLTTFLIDTKDSSYRNMTLDHQFVLRKWPTRWVLQREPHNAVPGKKIEWLTSDYRVESETLTTGVLKSWTLINKRVTDERDHIVIVASSSATLFHSTDKTGRIPLHYAVEAAIVPMVVYLVEVGSDPNAADSAGVTPVHLACLDEHVDILQFLVENGGDVTRCDSFGSNALHYAASSDNVAALSFLISAADRDLLCITDNVGFSPLDLAKQLSNTNAFLYLTSAEPRRRDCVYSRYCELKDKESSALQSASGTPIQRKTDDDTCSKLELIKHSLIDFGDERTKVVEAVMIFMNGLLGDIARMDGRFQAELRLVGGSADTTSTVFGDVDVQFILKNLFVNSADNAYTVETSAIAYVLLDDQNINTGAPIIKLGFCNIPCHVAVRPAAGIPIYGDLLSGTVYGDTRSAFDSDNGNPGCRYLIYSAKKLASKFCDLAKEVLTKRKSLAEKHKCDGVLQLVHFSDSNCELTFRWCGSNWKNKTISVDFRLALSPGQSFRDQLMSFLSCDLGCDVPLKKRSHFTGDPLWNMYEQLGLDAKKRKEAHRKQVKHNHALGSKLISKYPDAEVLLIVQPKFEKTNFA